MKISNNIEHLEGIRRYLVNQRFTDTGETEFHHVPRTEGTRQIPDTFGIGCLHGSCGLVL